MDGAGSRRGGLNWHSSRSQIRISRMPVYKRTQVRPDGTEVELPYYYYRFHLNGVTYRKCTKQSNKKAAEAQEAAHRTRVSNGEVGIVDQKDVDTHAAYPNL